MIHSANEREAPLEELWVWWFYNTLRKSWDAAPVRIRTGFILRPSPRLGSLGWAFLVWAPAAIWLTVANVPDLRHAPAAIWTALALSAASALLGLSMLIYSKRSFIFYSERGIAFRSTFGRPRHLAWRQIQELEYQHLRSRLSFRSRRGALSIGYLFRGFSGLLQQVQTSLPRAIWSAPLLRLDNSLWQHSWYRRRE